MANSTSKTTPRNPKFAKPYKDFPLTPHHRTNRWCKKVAGRFYYFGPLADWKAALAEWDRRREAIYAGRDSTEEKAETPTVRDLVIAFLKHKRNLQDAGELSARTFADDHRTCTAIAEHFGKGMQLANIGQEHFAKLRTSLASRLGPVALGNTIQRIRSVFKFGEEAGIAKGVLFGPGFKRPTKKTIRLERKKNGKKLVEREDLLKIIGVAKVPMKAMVLLALNAGLGNSDLANLPMSAIDFERGWVDYPRPKTGIDRRFPLWPETLQALKHAREGRGKSRDKADADILFITKYGRRWGGFDFVKNEPAEGQGEDEVTYKHKLSNPITKEFAKLMKAAGVDRRKGIGFYTLRHVFETRASGCRDQIAVDFVMGHADESMAANYRQEIDDERLSAVVNHVRAWLFAPIEKKPEGGAA